MTETMVMFCDRENDRIEGFGRRKFQTLPRIGECIEVEINMAHLDHDSVEVEVHRVVAVHHGGPVPVLYVVHVGERGAVLEGYRQSVMKGPDAAKGRADFRVFPSMSKDSENDETSPAG